MRLFYCIILTIICSVCCVDTAKATHIYGGELLYTHLTGDTYEIKLVLYGDCGGRLFDTLKTSIPKLWIYRNNKLYDSLELFEDSSVRKEVTPVCPQLKDSTACKNKTSVIPGVTSFLYKNNINLPPSKDWKINFTGKTGATSRAGRSVSITNIMTGMNGQVMYLQAFLNNENAPNSSPEYSSIPTPFYCINRPQQYNQGAIDPNGDSLSFSLINALWDGNTQITTNYTPPFDLTYVPPYSGDQPLSTLQGAFSFDPSSGQMNFTADAIQNSLVVNKVEEYKDGVLVGSSLREMTFIVINDCNNNPPTGIVDSNSITGGRTRDNVVNVCLNTPLLEFKIPVTDLDNDNVFITVANLPQGAKVDIMQNGTKDAYIQFSWSTLNIPLGVYNMFVTYKDDACPLFSSQTVAYTVNVVKDISVQHTVVDPTHCFKKQVTRFDLDGGVLPRLVSITHSNGTVVGNYVDSTGVIIDSLKPGTYRLLAESELLKCKTAYDFQVVDSGTYPYAPSHNNLDLCLYDEPQEITYRAVRGAPVHWYTQGKTSLPHQPSYTTDTPGLIHWYISQTIGVCESVLDSVKVYVHDFPEINIENKNDRVCIGEGIYLHANGGVRYEWGPEDDVIKYNGADYTYVNKPTTYTVTGYSEYNCPGRDTLTMDNIELCCTFAYPEAFTPNKDGMNDGWHPVTYGNMNFYLLSIYDRWGKRIFISSDPRERWDGTYNGKDCALGTYHYFLRAKCVAGKEEKAAGNITLLR